MDVDKSINSPGLMECTSSHIQQCPFSTRHSGNKVAGSDELQVYLILIRTNLSLTNDVWDT